MDHSRNLSLILCLYRNTISAITHGDHCILQIVSCTSVDQGSKLGVDPVIGDLHAAAYLQKTGTGTVADLVLGQDTTADLCRKRSKRGKLFKHFI